MRFAIGIAAGLTLAAAATVAAAAPSIRLNDAQFIAANRCLGLMTSKALATPDASTLNKLLKEQSWGRNAFIYDKADEARNDALADVDRAGAEVRARLVAERDGVCRALLDTATAGAPGAGHSS
jgi:hypothetical protein